ncbi:MAG: diguanylate cyclase [Phycisphaerae bacterium]
MTSSVVEQLDGVSAEPILVVASRDDGPTIRSFLSSRYPSFRVDSRSSMLSGIAAAASSYHRAVFVQVDERMPALSAGLSGFRRACGEATRFVLCCHPAHEGTARDGVAAGADDYVILPLEGDEVDAAIGVPSSDVIASSQPVAGDVSASLALPDVLSRLSSMLDQVESEPTKLLHDLASFALASLPASGLSLVVEGTALRVGVPFSKPVLTAPIERDGRVVGQLLLGEPSGRAFASSDMALLTLFAGFAGRLLGLSSGLRQYQVMAMTDACTSLPNRRYLNERLDSILADAARKHHPVSLLLFDVDDFKSYNDAYGHAVGDQILRGMGRLFQQQCRQHDIVARFGGDEFAVVFWDPSGPRVPGSRHPDCAMDVLDRVKTSLLHESGLYFGDTVQGRLTISGGVATYPWDAGTRDGLIARADEALLDAKRSGKNRVIVIGEREG